MCPREVSRLARAWATRAKYWAATAFGANVGKGLRADFTGSRDVRGDVLLYDLAGLHIDQVLGSLVQREPNDGEGDEHTNDNQNDLLLCFHECLFKLRQKSGATEGYIYASRTGKVPAIQQYVNQVVDTTFWLSRFSIIA